MREVKITFSNEAGREMTVIGQGSATQTPEQIVELTRPKVRKYLGTNGDDAELTVREFTLPGETDSRDYMTIQVNNVTEESYCLRYAGRGWKNDTHTTAEGPVGPTRL